MGQIAHQSSLRPDHSGTFTKGEIEKYREEDRKKQEEAEEETA
jgi:hypothetical protein